MCSESTKEASVLYMGVEATVAFFPTYLDAEGGDAQMFPALAKLRRYRIFYYIFSAQSSMEATARAAERLGLVGPAYAWTTPTRLLLDGPANFSRGFASLDVTGWPPGPRVERLKAEFLTKNASDYA